MSTVLELCEKPESDFDADAVHDLRVALRRCRTMADALSEVNPDPGWRKMKKSSRRYFRPWATCATARWSADWVKKLGGAGDSFRRHLLESLAELAKRAEAAGASALGRFDRKEWRKSLAEAVGEGGIFPCGVRGFSAAGAGPARGTCRAFWCGAASEEQGGVAPLAHWVEAVPLHAGKFHAEAV